VKLTNHQLTISLVLSNVEGPINQDFVVLSCKSCLKVSLQLSRELYKSNLFMQNKAKFKNAIMNVTPLLTIGYENLLTFCRSKNKANSNPILAQNWLCF